MGGGCRSENEILQNVIIYYIEKARFLTKSYCLYPSENPASTRQEPVKPVSVRYGPDHFFGFASERMLANFSACALL